MKKIIVSLILGFCLLVAAPAHAEPNGQQIFQANCAVCHANGANRIVANKTLKKDALAQYNMDSKEAIVMQIKKGKSAMPAFLGRLNESQIEAVAEYVLSQAETGW
ncbi:MAG: c-type cytochrome [Cyanobacteria bacterium]|nr:c-type cytochrome [Cyanobacteria bacterium GSL.Bin21]